MADIKVNPVGPLSGRTPLERTHGPSNKPSGDFDKTLELVQAKGAAPDMAALKDKARAVIESFERDAAQFNELMKASQNQARLIQSMMNTKPDADS